MSEFFKYLLSGFFILATGFSCFSQEQSPIVISGWEGNDLVEILQDSSIPYVPAGSADEAIRIAAPGSSVLIFAKGYPERRTRVSNQSFRAIENKNLEVYIEYPASVPGLTIENQTKKITLERGVVLSAQIHGLDSLDLLSINDHALLQVQYNRPLIGVAKVAGYDKADYGVEDTQVYPLLFKTDNIWIATTKLSDVIPSRFGPSLRWKKVWEFILSQLQHDETSFKRWTPEVRPTYSKHEALGDMALKESIQKGSEWFYNARLLIHPSWLDTFLNRTKKNGEGVVFPGMPEQAPIGDGRLGILEGHASYIYADGTQPVRWWLRADCQAEVAFALSSASNLLGTEQFSGTAANLLHALYKTTNLRQGERDDPESPSFGLIGWATTDPDAYYGDDNARVLLATIGAVSNMNTHEWDNYIVEGVLGNFRTSGIYGFRGPWFRDASMQKTTWEALAERTIVNVHPHYESWLWACYLWLYDKTGYTPLLDKAKQAIAMTMEAYPNWKWTNGIQQEYARMILPLAWLVRVEDTPEHREWLKRIADKLLEDLQPSGAIREELGTPGMGRYERIQSNAEYGEKEAPLISENGDPVSDLLYTMNYAFFSLNEAWAATGDAAYREAVQKIQAYLIRIQVHSPRHPELDGAWFRAFDYKRWDYWASNADSGWGPWGTQTGWTQSWILNSLMLSYAKENFWDKTSHHYADNKRFNDLVQKKIEQMLK